MKVRDRYSRRFRFLKLLRASLAAGALYDLIFAALMLFAPTAVARVFDLPLPGSPFYLWLIAIFLTMLAILYLQAALDPRRYSAIIAVAIGGRLSGAVAFAVAAWQEPSLQGLYPLAGADAVLGLVVLFFWWPVR